MPWAAAAAVAGAAIGSSATRSAANTAAGATDRATEAQGAQFAQAREDQAPFREAGYRGLTRLEQILGTGGDAGAADYGMLTRGYTGADLLRDPGYQFELEQGNKAIENRARAGTYSGATLKALQRFGQGLASTKFNEGFNRDRVQRNDLFNQLSGITGTGQVATNQVGAAGQNYANRVGDLAIGNANAQGAARVNQGNIWGNALNQGVSAWQRGGGFGGGGGSPGDGYAGATNYGQYGTVDLGGEQIIQDGY